MVAALVTGSPGCTSHADRPPAEGALDHSASAPAPLANTSPTPPEPDRALDAAARRSDISSDEEVQLFPGFVGVDEAGRVRGRLEGWIYEPEEEDALRRVFLSSLRRGLGSVEEELEAGRAVYRIRPFIYDDERGERVEVQMGDQLMAASVSGKGGRFYVPVDFEAPSYASAAATSAVMVRAVTKPRDQRVFETPVFVLPPAGTIVVSDIDDTIKISEVRDKAKLLRNTFIEPFAVVPDMATTYRDWLASSGGATHLHFLSSSPWQLLNPLEEMIVRAGFPEHSYTLRDFRVDVMDAAELLTAPDDFKGRALEQIFERLPGWKVVLVGDSGERDPEIYAEAARNHPDQVVAVFIRNVTGEGPDAPRFARCFDGLDDLNWQVFGAASELPDAL